VAVKAKRGKWNPSHHPRDARGRFTRSSTRVLKPEDRKRAAAGQAGFKPAEFGDAAARTEWLQRESAATPSAGARISAYLDGGWRTDNPAMRAGKPVDGVDQLDDAFTPLGDDVMLRRIVPSAMFAHIPISDLVGMKVRDAAPASTSLDHDGPGHPGAVTMHIAAPAGTRAYVNDDAGEVLLMRDTEVAITRAVARPDGNGWDLYGVLIPRKDAPARAPKRDQQGDDETPVAGTRAPAGDDENGPAEGDETTAGGVGAGSGADAGGDDGTTAPAAAPAGDPAPALVLWKDAETGRPVYSPGQPEIVRKQVVRDPEREERVRRGMAIAAAAMAGEPEATAVAAQRPAGDLDAPETPDAPDAGAPETPAAGTAAPADGPDITGAPQDVVRAAVGDKRFATIKGAATDGGRDLDAQFAGELTAAEKTRIRDAIDGGPLDHDAITAALGDDRYRAIWSAAIMPSTRDQDRDAVIRAALDAQLTDDEKSRMPGAEAPAAAGDTPDAETPAEKPRRGRRRAAEPDDQPAAPTPSTTAAAGELPGDATTLAEALAGSDLEAPADQEKVRAYLHSRIGDFTDAKSGITATAGTVKSTGGRLSVRWTLVNDRGEKVGNAKRTLELNTVTGEPYVTNQHLDIDDKNLRGGGFAARFNRRNEEFWQANGFETLRLTANTDVGGYAWARDGYDFDSYLGANNLGEQLRAALDQGSFGSAQWDDATRAQAEDLIARAELPGPEFFRLLRDGNLDGWEADKQARELGPTPLEFAMLGWTPDSGEGKAAMWPGKQFMLAQQWNGVKSLAATPDAGDDTAAAGTGAPDAPETPAAVDVPDAGAPDTEVPAASTDGPAAGGPRIPAGDGEVPSARENPAGWAAAQTDAELERVAGIRSALPRVKKAIANEQRIRNLSPEEMAVELRLDPAVSSPTRGNFAELGLTSPARVIFFGTKTRDPKARGEVATLTLSGGRNPHVMVRGEGDDSSLLMRLDAKTDRFWAAPVDAPDGDQDGRDTDTPDAGTPDAPQAGSDQDSTAGTGAPADAPAEPAPPAEPGSDRALGDLAVANIQTHSEDDFAALDAGGEIERGDLVVVKSFNRYRTAVVLSVSSRGKVEAVVATPSSPDRVYGARGQAGTEVKLLRKGAPLPEVVPADDQGDGTPLDQLDGAPDAPATDAPTTPDAGDGDQGDATPAAAEPAAPAIPDTLPDGRPLDADRDLARKAQQAAGIELSTGLSRRSERMSDPAYKRDYNRGYKASEGGSASLERGDARGEGSAWYDGWSDYSVGEPKWTTPKQDDANDRGVFAGEPMFRVQAYRIDPDGGERTESGRAEAFYGRERLAMHMRDMARTEIRAEDFRDDESGTATSDDGRYVYEWTATPQDQLTSRTVTEEDLIRRYLAANPDAIPAAAGAPETPAAGTSAPDAPAAPAAGAELAGLPAADQARIRIAVADHAAKLAANPMLNGDPDDVARYLSEGELTKVTDRHGLRTVWAAVAQALRDDPDAMRRPQADTDAARTARAAEAARLSSEAAAATRGGDFAGALAMIDQGEQTDPDYRTDRGRSWEELRTLVTDRQSRAEADNAAAAAELATPAAGTGAPDAAAPIVAGSVNDQPLTDNNWGGTGEGSPVHYHPDGAIGRLVDGLGAEARLDVDGLPLAEYLNRLATEGARLQITAQEQVTRLRDLADRMPDGRAKRAIAMAADDLDAPASPMPAVPEGTPEPLARLMAEIWAVPMVRRDGPDALEVAGLLKIIGRANRGGTSNRRLADLVRSEVLNRRHESKEGKTEIDTAARRAMRDMEALPAPATSQSATSQDAPAPVDLPTPVAAAPAEPSAGDLFAAMTTRTPRTVSRADAAAVAAGAAGAAEVDMFGNVTAFVPARREAIGLGARPEVGRERQIAAAQQLGLLDETEAGGGLGGETALFGLFDMPAADPPPTAAALPVTDPDADRRDALAARVIAEDLDDWTDEQLSGAFADLTSGDELTPDQETALQRIGDLWDGREAEMRDLVAGIPADLTTLSDDDAVGLLVALTSTRGTLDDAAVARVNADLDRREAEATEAARRSAELGALAGADTATFTSHEQYEATHQAAADLGDWDRVETILNDWTTFEDAENARLEAERVEAERVERERLDAERVRLEAAAAAEAQRAAEAERVRIDNAMIAARAAAAIPPTDDGSVRSAHATLGEEGTRRAIGAEKYDAIVDAIADSPLNTDDARRFAIRAQLLNLGEGDRARMVMAAADIETPDDVRELGDMELLLETLTGRVPETGETPEQAEAREARLRAINAEQSRRGMMKLRAEGLEAFARYREKLRTTDPAELTDAELAGAPGTLAGDPDADLVGKLGAIRAEADRRQAEAADRATRKAAGPQAPARLANPIGELAQLERMTEGYRDTDYGREAGSRLWQARALTVGLPVATMERDIVKAEKADERSHYERAAWTVAWYRHLAEFADIDDRYRGVYWVAGPDDQDDVPDVPMPLPGAKIPKAVEAWEAMKQQAIYDRRAGINTGAERYTMALARSYGIPFDRDDRSEEAMRRLGSANADAMRGDSRTAAQQAASFIAEWRRLAAEDGVDHENHLLYGPPDKRPKALPRTQWAPTADEEIRVDRLVAEGWEWDEAFARVMGADLDDLRREQAASAATGVARPTDKVIKQHYEERVTRQFMDAEAATNGYLLNKLGVAKGIEPDSLFSGDPDRAYRFASEELMRFWGEPGNERLTFTEYKAQLVGESRSARGARRAAASERNQFA
jgi:hypothetical protein